MVLSIGVLAAYLLCFIFLVGGLCAFLSTLFLGHIGACTSIWRLSSFERRLFSILSGICSEFLGGMMLMFFGDPTDEISMVWSMSRSVSCRKECLQNAWPPVLWK
ncbi:hypothetical protein H5410_002041 [Solanum commersonii]|uniref:Uncharacterized protein n=1 Tax=Solanum commersonii TaxID=4109 RepID=A0A9J6B0Y4_SOLCO|nr:hypothetical protein H5410_002041 [Solanum commersonii]